MTVRAPGRADQAGARRRRASPTGTPTPRDAGDHARAGAGRLRRRRAARGAATAARCWPPARSAPIAGRVCMDQFVLDVGDDAGRAPATRSCCWGPGDARRADRAAVGRRRRHHPLRAGHPGRRPVRPPLRRLGGGGLMAARHRSGRPAPAGSPASPAPSSAWRPPGRRSASRSAGVAVAACGPSSAGRRDGGRRADARAGAAPRTRSARPPARPTGPRWCRPTTACCSRSRRSARGRAADRRLRARLHAVDGVAGPSSGAPWPPSWPPRTGTGPTPGWSSTTSAATARRAAGRPSTRRSSSWPATSATVLDARVPRGPVVLVGHSMGGMTDHGPGRAAPGAVRLPGRRRRAGLHLQRQPGRPELRAAASCSPGCARRSSRWPPGRCAAGPAFAERTRRLAADIVSAATWSLSFASTDVDPALGRYVDAMIAGTPVDVIAEFYPALAGLDHTGSLEPLRGVPDAGADRRAGQDDPQGAQRAARRDSACRTTSSSSSSRTPGTWCCWRSPPRSPRRSPRCCAGSRPREAACRSCGVRAAGLTRPP